MDKILKTDYVIMTNGEKYRIQICEYHSSFFGLLKWTSKSFYHVGFNIVEYDSIAKVQEKIDQLQKNDLPWNPVLSLG